MPDINHPRVGDARGFRSEAMVEEALYSLKERPRYNFKAVIKHIFRAPKCSPLDHARRDFIVTIENHGEIPIQAKSSQSGRRDHDKKCRKANEVIPCVVVDKNDGPEAVVRKVVKCIKRTLEAMRLGFIRQMRAGYYSILKDTQTEPSRPRRNNRDGWCPRFETFRHCSPRQFAFAR